MFNVRAALLDGGARLWTRVTLAACSLQCHGVLRDYTYWW